MTMTKTLGFGASMLALASCLALSACNSQGGVGEMTSGETAGTGLGAVGGGLLGYAIGGGPAGVLIGMAAGGLVGNRIGNGLDGDAQTAAGQAAARAAESNEGQVITWRKTDALWQTEAQGTATPKGALFTDSSGRTCRYVYETVIQNGTQANDTVKLCKGSSGWVAG
jgi:osmotically inducible lipoprotein OsmB